MCPQNVTSGVQTQQNSARSACSIVPAVAPTRDSDGQLSMLSIDLLPKILAAPNRRSLATPGWVQTNLFFSSGRHFYLSPLAMQKVTTPLCAKSKRCNILSCQLHEPVVA